MGLGIAEVHEHAVAHVLRYKPGEALHGSFTQVTTREAFRIAHDISSYSLTALARESLPFMKGRAGAIVTLSYLGAMRSLPGYNVMGLAKASLEANVRFLAADLGPLGHRVNAISAGPIKTLSAAGIPGLRRMLAHVASVSPIKRNVTIEDVGNTAAFLCSDSASFISGCDIRCDGGLVGAGRHLGLGN